MTCETTEKKTRLSPTAVSLAKLWETCKPSEDFRKREDTKMALGKIQNRQVYYQKAEKRTGVPWQVIAAIHYMECNCDMKRQILNGEKYTQETTRVPIGKGPWHDWEESAVEALAPKEKDFEKNKKKDWSIGNALYFLEKHNGLGYRKRKLNSPYLWSFTNHYVRGKYVGDGEFDPKAVSKQVGAALILKGLDYESRFRA